MATIIGGSPPPTFRRLAMRSPRACSKDPYWKPFFDGFRFAHRWLARTKPDVAVVVYNDHGLNFFLDKMPTFAVGAAGEYRNADEGWGIPVSPVPGRSRRCPGTSSSMGGRATNST